MNQPSKLAFVALLAWSCSFAGAANLSTEWARMQTFEVAGPGLVKLSLPVPTLDAARPGLEDLRVCDAAGNELPYLVQHPVPAVRFTRKARSFQVTLQRNTTVIVVETGLNQPVDEVALESPAGDFIKSVQIEASADGQRWQMLAQGRPIFRQPGGASQLRLAVPAGVRPWLRLTLDDERSQAIPITGVQVQAAAGPSAPGESFTATISDRHENPGETRLTLDLGAANLNLTSVEIETDAPLFQRPVTLVEPQVAEDAIRERVVGQGVIYRIAVDGQPVCTNLTVTLDQQVHSRELLLLLQNHDSPPLPISAVRVERRPVYLVFLAPAAGRHHLLVGHPRCAAPRYDLAAFGTNLSNVAVSACPLSPLTNNPNFRAPEVLAGVEPKGAALDLAGWQFRKLLKLERSGPQQLELDLDILAQSQRDLGDLRLVHAGTQLPYVVQRTSISRAIAPEVSATIDPRDKALSRWILKLPRAGLPVTRLACTTRSTLFERELMLSEEVVNEHGEKFRHNLGRATWTQTPARQSRELTLALETSPETDTLFLEARNGDNPPIEMEQFKLFYPATRLLFKAGPQEALHLYYGNPEATAPRYDLGLVAGQLLAADKSAAALGAEERLKRSSWADSRKAGQGGVVFWGALAVVVAALLFVIARLLPKEPPKP